jgi:DNA-binding Lrp family transcriptional regulator
LDISSEMMSRTPSFPEEPLDHRDRKLIQTIGMHVGKGIGFNRLVEESKPFASRSTVAVRIERLIRLGYLERLSAGGRPGRERPVRLTFRCYSLVLSIDRAREIAARLHSEIRAMQQEEERPGEADVERWADEFRERYNALFGLVGSMAAFYGTSAAGDLFLPPIVEDYKNLFAHLLGMLRQKRPDLLRSLGEIIGDEVTTGRGLDTEEIRKKTRDALLDPAVHRFRDWDAAP